MIQALIFTGLMAIIQIEAISIKSVHTDEIIIEGVVLLIADFDGANCSHSENVQVIRDFLEVSKVVTENNIMGFNTEVWIL